jgi:hypothetical protein
MSEAGKRTHGVQMKVIIAPRPRTPDRSVLFKYHWVDSAALQGSGSGEAGCSGADDYDGGLRHRSSR